MTTMKTINQNKTPDIDSNNDFDALCQGFDGGSFYGLEYILEDFFQNTTVTTPAVPIQHSIDWFGLYT
jgi:hypothetical protein